MTVTGPDIPAQKEASGDTFAMPPVSRVIAAFLIFLILMTGLLFLLLNFENSEIEKSLKADSVQQVLYIGETISKALELPLWNLDSKLAQDQLESLRGNPSICGAHILDNQGNLFAEAGLLSKNPGKGQEIHTFNIASPNKDSKAESIGKLLVCSSNLAAAETMAQNKKKKSTILIVTFSGCLAIYLLSLLVILKPSRIGRSLKRGIPAFLGILTNFFLSPFYAWLGKDNAKLKLPWHYVYFILAGFDILTVCISLYINHTLVEMYNRAAAANMEWAVMQKEVLNLADLSVAMSAPGNDVFMSNNPDEQKKKFDAFFSDFHTALADTTARISDTFYKYRELDFLNENKKDLMIYIESIKMETPAILMSTNAIFKNFSEGNKEEAGNFMAQMDQNFALQATRLSKVAQDISRIQNKLSAHQAHQAEYLQKLEFVIFMLAVMMVVFAVIYGKQLSVQMKRDQAELERHRHNLEQTVAEQTKILREESEKNIELRVSAESASQAKSDFLATMSHELRTPLNSVIGHVQILENERISTEQRETFGDIRRSAETLLQIVNDILDFSKIEAGEVKLEYNGFDAYQKIRHTVQALKPMANKKGLSLSCEVDAEKLLVLGDQMRFQRILTNLVDNAIRYTEKGGIEVMVRSEKTASDCALLRCEVRDTGIGIDTGTQSKLFQKFTQADSSTTRKYGGTGLGLAITKEVVELMGGCIGVDSQQDKGSVFWFEIPFKTVNQIEVSAFDNFDVESWFEDVGIRPTPDQVKVLMAEDHEMNQKFMKKLFKNLGFTNFKIVENGIDVVHEMAARNYDIVLMDCHMPEMNGYDATVKIRRLSDVTKNSVPIIGITANAMPEDEKRCLEIGMTSYISKPVNINVFKKKLSPWIKFESNQKMREGPVEVALDNAPVNLDNLKDNSMGDDAFVKEMIALFISQGAIQIEKLKDLCVEGKSYNWVEISHALKGTAGNVGAEAMRSLCADAQNMEETTAQERKTILDSIEQRYNQAKSYFIEQKMYDA